MVKESIERERLTETIVNNIYTRVVETYLERINETKLTNRQKGKNLGRIMETFVRNGRRFSKSRPEIQAPQRKVNRRNENKVIDVDKK